MDFDAYRARAQAYATDLNRGHYRAFAGLGGRWQPAAIHARHAPGLFDDATIDALREAGAERLLRFALEARVAAETAAPDAARAAAEADEGLAELSAALADEDDVVRRVALEEQRLDIALRRLTAPAAEALERVRALARRLGWPSARSMLSVLHGADLGALAAEAEELLRATARPVFDHDAPLARHDLPRATRAAWADAALPADPVAHLRAALDRHGLPERFAIDDDPRPGKSSRAFCAAMVVPGDVHLVVAPSGRLPDLLAVFHEAGHALQLSLRDKRAPFEDRHLVPRVDAEAVAFAFERLVLEGVDDGAVHEHVAALDALRTRHLAASLLHDLDLLDDGPVPALRERYARRMAAATGLSWPSAPWLASADPTLAAADYLRALGRARALDPRAAATYQ